MLGGYLALIVSLLYRVNLPVDNTNGVSLYFALALLLAFLGSTKEDNKSIRMTYYSIIVDGIITPLFSGQWHRGNFSIL